MNVIRLFEDRVRESGANIDRASSWQGEVNVVHDIANGDTARMTVSRELAEQLPLFDTITQRHRDAASRRWLILDEVPLVGVVSAQLDIAETGSVLIAERDSSHTILLATARDLIQIVSSSVIVETLDEAAFWLADNVVKKKLEYVATIGVKTLITDNPGCVLHLRSGVNASGGTIEVRRMRNTSCSVSPVQRASSPMGSKSLLGTRPDPHRAAAQPALRHRCVCHQTSVTHAPTH